MVRIGIIGGGQLGKLLVEVGFQSNRIRYSLNQVELWIYSPEVPLANPVLYSKWVQGELNDSSRMVSEFGQYCDVITYEIESVSLDALRELRDGGYQKRVIPDLSVLENIQDKGVQKDYLIDMGIPVPKYMIYDRAPDEAVYDFCHELLVKDGAFINKSLLDGYDGYGVAKKTDVELFTLHGMVEELINIEKELALIVCRDKYGAIDFFPVTEMVMTSQHKLSYSVCPARVDSDIVAECRRLGQVIAEGFQLEGIMAIEFFLEKGGRILVNECSPRPHNSGHQTIELCQDNQYTALSSILCGLELKYVNPRVREENQNRVAILENVIGDNGRDSIDDSMDDVMDGMDDILVTVFPDPKIELTGIRNVYDRIGFDDSLQIDVPVLSLYDYRKSYSKPGRKLGHIVSLLDNREIMVSYWLSHLTINNRGRYLVHRPRVSVIMGSMSDYSVVAPCLSVLDSFGVHYQVEVVSAHRTPAGMLEYSTQAEQMGIQVIVAAAGGAAHLPGMVASVTSLPVIGIPICSSNSIDGWDSLLSIAQMPGGVPVATMGLDGAKNAGLMALRILGLSDPSLKTKMNEYQDDLKKKVEEQNHDLRIELLRKCSKNV